MTDEQARTYIGAAAGLYVIANNLEESKGNPDIIRRLRFRADDLMSEVQHGQLLGLYQEYIEKHK